MRDLVRYLLMYGVLPLWILAGLVDWWCHRRAGIETTSGGRESVFHLVMFAQTGLGGIAAMILQVNLGLLALLVLLFLLHECTTWLELRFVNERRKINSTEQMVHSFMELLPLAAILLLADMYDGSGEWSLRVKDEPLPVTYLVTSCVAVTALNIIPLIEEAWRCGHAERYAGQSRASS